MDDLERWNALRVLDANRAGEGLRTIEDVARLVRADSQATTWVKELRHRLAAANGGVRRRQEDVRGSYQNCAWIPTDWMKSHNNF